jgi:hypothetical protein
MEIKDGREIYYASSGTTSSVVRQLGLAGIAVIWLLAGGLQKSGVHLTEQLRNAGLLIVVALFVDLLQYVWTTGNFAVWVRIREKRWRDHLGDHSANVNDKEIGNAPGYVLPIMWVLFYLKAALTTAAYILIFMELHGRIVVDG